MKYSSMTIHDGLQEMWWELIPISYFHNLWAELNLLLSFSKLRRPPDHFDNAII